MNIPLSSVEFTVSMFIIWALMFIAWRNYRTDRLREQLFSVRNDLFDYAARGGIDFDDPSYQMLRNTMNGLIRFGERVSFVHFCIVTIGESQARQPYAASAMRRWKKNLSTLNPEQREKLSEFNARLNAIMIDSLIFSSPTLRLSLGIANYLKAAFDWGTRIQSKLHSGVKVLEAEALRVQEVEVGLAAA